MALYEGTIPMLRSNFNKIIYPCIFPPPIPRRLHRECCWCRQGSQQSPHTLISFPSPTLHMAPFCRISLAESKLRHASEGREPGPASHKVVCGKYLACMIRATKEFRFCRILHSCLAKRALLNIAKSLNPMPPLAFDKPILSQLINESWSCFPCVSTKIFA